MGNKSTKEKICFAPHRNVINYTKIYVLELTDNKYYIGKTNSSIRQCYQQHIDGLKSKYAPIKILMVRNNTNVEDEKNISSYYIDKYGDSNCIVDFEI